MPADRMAGELFKLGVKLGAIHVHLGHVERRVEMWALARRVPSGAGGQLALLDEHHIRPALKRQMIEQAYAHHATTDNNHSGMRFHVFRPTLVIDLRNQR